MDQQGLIDEVSGRNELESTVWTMSEGNCIPRSTSAYVG